MNVILCQEIPRENNYMYFFIVKQDNMFKDVKNANPDYNLTLLRVE